MSPESQPFEIFESATFAGWLRDLKDRRARDLVLARSRRMAFGNFGDARSVGEGVSELRIDHGPGYRVYFARQGLSAVILLCAGNKRTQRADIRRARQIAKAFTE